MEKTEPNPALKKLLEPSQLAIPTILLFMMAVALTGAALVLEINGEIPRLASVLLHALAVYWFFTVMHDASHSAISTRPWVNTLFGHLSILSFSPLIAYRAFRFIHMQHHRFTNQHRSIDPDHWCGSGSRWTLPLRWATLDLYYYYFYFKNWRKRPTNEIVATLTLGAIGLSTLTYGIHSGYGEFILWHWYIPARIAIFFLGLAFDFLPHYPYKATREQNPYQATNNRIGLEWLLTPLLCFQNYHLIHHLHPLVPFYRYIKIWKANHVQLMKNKPLLVSPLGKEIT